MAKMTIDEKIAYYEDQLSKLRAVKEANSFRDNVEQGDRIAFYFGRGSKRRALEGTVIGMKDDTNGRWIKAAVGEGFDLETFAIRPVDIIKNLDADSREKLPVGEAADKGAEKAAPVTKDPLDPLEAE